MSDWPAICAFTTSSPGCCAENIRCTCCGNADLALQVDAVLAGRERQHRAGQQSESGQREGATASQNAMWEIGG